LAHNLCDILILLFAVDSLIEVGNQIHRAENVFLYHAIKKTRRVLSTSLGYLLFSIILMQQASKAYEKNVLRQSNIL
jgi:membrane protein required for beta-lactamase induction